ncbi:MAG: ABC transporter permease [Bacteroidota bacterium]|nr:ABC transporter permease [Bacteroidota bacterium]
MLKNYFKIAWRNLAKNRAYSSINIFGLAIGMTVALLIGLWIADELSFNKSFANYDRVLRVMENSTHNGKTETTLPTPIPLALEMRTKYAGDFKAVALASWNNAHGLTYGDKLLSKNGMFAEPQIQDILSLRMVKGGPGALNAPNSLLICRSLAQTLFGDADPMNKVIRMDDRMNLKVTGVFEDFPWNTEFRDTYLIAPWSTFEADQSWVRNSRSNWDNNSFQTYAQLQDHADLDKVAAKLKSALTGHDRKDKPEVILHPMAKWKLFNEFTNGVNSGGGIQFVWMFGAIGLFVLLLACINFMNLSTARSERRAKEVGIRKAVGSLRGQLIGQFLGESLLITFLALTLSLVLTSLSLPWFNQLADKQMHISWNSPLFWTLLIAFMVFTGLVAGSYPAFYLSSFPSVKVLKGTFKAGRMAALPRKILVVLQFTVSVSLIVGTIIVYKQIEYAHDRPVGYTREGLITVLANTMDLYTHYNSIRNDLIRSGAAANVAMSASPTTNIWSNQSGFDWPGKDPNMEPTFAIISVTHDFGNTVGWQFLSGRDFSRDYASDSSGLVLNEAAVRYMGLKHPVGTNIKYLYSSYRDKNFRVIGVVNDMVMESPFTPTRPTIFAMDTAAQSLNVITVKINPAMSTTKAMPIIGTIFKKYNPGSAFDYRFNDDEYARKFNLEERIGRLAAFFTAFAIFISCLGLFGLASFMAEQRTKEIGVRKVLGASMMHLWGLLSKEFLLLVFISFFIAIPVSWYVMHNWLQQYYYRTTVSIWIFVATMGLSLLITMMTVSFQSIRAALANPAKSLRTE